MRTARLVAALEQHLVTGKMPAIPAGGDLIYRWFADLSMARSWHYAGPNPISYAEIEAYCRLHRWPMEPHHVDAIRALDRAFVDQYHHAVTKRNDGAKGGSIVSERPMSAGLFDAMFG